LSQASEFKEFRFKPAERPLFREINQSPLILYPIKETVNQTRHKISLMIQAHLGCVQYPDSSEAAKVRRQLMVERKLVFERLNRLIRAVIDCKGYDRDSVGVRNALELARALAAGSWEGRATQLTQIPNIGPAGMRKLASKDIRTVLELADKTHDEIERLMSRQPPFGKNLQSHLEQFPRLAMDVVMVDKKIQPRSPDPVVIDVKATVRYLNHKGLPVWLQRVPALTFLAESNDGTLVYFWRGSMRKLDKQSGLELKFSVGLRDGRDCVTCYFSCEEIVGTIVSQTLEPKIPAAAFLAPPAQRNLVPVPRTKTSPRDYPNSDEIEDSDLLAAERALSQHANDTTEMEEEYPPVEDLLDLSPAESHEGGEEANLQFDASFDGEDEESSHTSMREPVQLPNGRWRCNHACSGGVPTRSGKPCTHRCCKEGIDKPRRRPLRRLKRNADEPVPGDATYAAAIGQSNVRQQQSGVAPSSRALGQTKRRKIQPMKSSTETSFATLSERPAISSKSGWEDLSDIDCIDLSFTDEEKDDTDALKNRTNDSDQLPEKERKAPQQTAHKHAHKELHGQSNWPKATLTPNETARPSEPPSSGARTHDYFDDDDFSLDEELSAPVTTAHIPTTTSFKSGASDEVLYQGICKRFSETSSAPMPDKTAVSEAMPGVAEKPVSSQQSSTLFVEQTPVKMATKQPDETLAMNESVTARAAVTHQFGSDRTLKQDNEPDWVAQFDPELVNMFRGYVTFV
jgi:ATP-dependent DNA helicase HFM1/MER3